MIYDTTIDEKPKILLPFRDSVTECPCFPGTLSDCRVSRESLGFVAHRKKYQVSGDIQNCRVRSEWPIKVRFAAHRCMYQVSGNIQKLSSPECISS